MEYNIMDKETAKFVLYTIFKADEQISQLIVNPLKYDTVKLDNDELETRVTKAVVEVMSTNSNIIWAILKEFPELEQEIEETIKKFKKLP